MTEHAVADGRTEAVAYHDSIAAGWGKGYQRGSFARRLQAFLPVLDRRVEAGGRWRDLGRGAGVLTMELLARGARVEALDGSAPMLESAKASAGERAAQVSWHQGDVRKLDFAADAGFDGVLCSSVIEYLGSPDALLAEAARVIRPGGTLVISAPPTWSLLRTAQKLHRLIAGKGKHAYLGVSTLELAVSRFDPVTAIEGSRLLRPALLIIEARRR